MKHVFENRLVALLLVGITLSLAGCEQGKSLPQTGATLEGTVKFNDKPLYYGLIIVQNSSGSATGSITQEGTYRVENAPLGQVSVAVNTPAGEGDYRSLVMSQSQGKGEGGAKGKVKPFVNVPEKYHAPETSGITTTVKKGANTLNIVVPKK